MKRRQFLTQLSTQLCTLAAAPAILGATSLRAQGKQKITYAHLGMKHSVFSTLGPSVWAHGLRAWRAGFRQQRTQGDPFQQGGVLVVRRGGELEYSSVSEEAGDHPPLDLVMSSARRIGSARSTP